MSETSSKRREWIKTAAIIFLSVLLVLTFFSQTILNHSLPEVATKYVQNGTITSKIRGSGVVESNDPNVVEVSQIFAERKITSIAVKVGDKVKKGDVLLTLAEGDGAELKDKKEALKTAEKKLEADQKSLKSMQSDYEGSKVNSEISNEDIRNLTTYRNKIVELQSKQQEAEEKLKPIEVSIGQLNKAIEDCEAQIEYEQAQNSYASERVTTAQTAVTQAQNAQSAAEAEQAAAQAQKDALIEQKAALEAAYAEDPASVEDYDAKMAELDGKLAEADKKLTEKNTALAKANEALQKANEEMNAANAGQDARDVSPAINNLREQIAKYKLDLYGYTKQKAQVETEINDIKTEIAEYQRKSESISGLQKSQDEISEMKATIAEDKKAVEDIKKEIDELTGENGGSDIKAEISGTIISINSDLVSGKKLPREACGELMRIQPEGQGYYMTFSVSNEQARTLSVGDKASLVNSWYYNDMDIILKSIKPDKTDPAKQKMLTFTVDGEVTAGQSLNVSVGQKSQNYDYIVPNSALRNDNNGDYILIVEAKSSPLGNRYIATRVDVQILAKDDTQAAISGGLAGWEYVITTASAPIKAGDQVRLADN